MKASKSKPKVVFLKNEMLPFSVLFYIGNRPPDNVVGDLARKHGLWSGEGRIPTVGDGYAGTVQFGSGSIVWLKSIDLAPVAMKSLCHELVHVLSNLGETIGERPSFKNDELFAYFAGWLMQNLMRAIQRKH